MKLTTQINHTSTLKYGTSVRSTTSILLSFTLCTDSSNIDSLHYSQFNYFLEHSPNNFQNQNAYLKYKLSGCLYFFHWEISEMFSHHALSMLTAKTNCKGCLTVVYNEHCHLRHIYPVLNSRTRIRTKLSESLRIKKELYKGDPFSLLRFRLRFYTEI